MEEVGEISYCNDTILVSMIPELACKNICRYISGDFALVRRQ